MDGGTIPREVTLVAARVQWSEVAREHMELIDDQPAHIDADFYREQVEGGEAELIGVFAVDGAGERVRVGSLVTRFEYGNRGRELVILAAGGRAPVNAVPVLFPLWEQLARDAGCVGARFETSRRGLVKWAQRRGWRADTINLRIEL